MPGLFTRLTLEQVQFVETFVRCEGKLTRMERELGLSYPTVRNRLREVIRALGYEPGGEAAAGVTEAERRQILEDLYAGRIDCGEALLRLER